MSNIPSWKSDFIFVKETLIFDLRLGLITDFRHGQGSFSYSYLTEPFNKDLWNRLRRHTLEAQTFLEPIVYLAGLSSSEEHALSNPSIFVDGGRLVDQPVDVGSPSMEPLWSIVDNEQVESSSLSKDKGVSGFELPLKRKLPCVSPPPTTVPKGTGKHPRVLARFVRSLANGYDSLTPDVEEAHVAHNMISGLHCPLLKDKLRFLSFDELVDVFDKAITYGRSHALDEVYDLGNSLDFKDVQDYHPKAEKLFDKDSEALYKLEFHYISLLSALRNLWLLRLPPSKKPLLHDVIFFYIREAL
nr:hypothetical protein [Tanacetum cinerariifolium]